MLIYHREKPRPGSEPLTLTPHRCWRRSAALLVAVCVSWLPAVASAQLLFSPGKLTRAHASFEHRCVACHDNGPVVGSRCLACHKELGKRIAAHKGFHGRRDVSRCTSCHIEHRGQNFKMIKWPGGKTGFDHSSTGFALKGKHLELDCKKCHQPSQQKDPHVRRWPAARRARTFLGLGTTCASCHEDFHKGAIAHPCESCHHETGFKSVTNFREHNKARFVLTGKHEKVACARCHRARGKTWAFRGGLSFGSCRDCHRSPHHVTMGQKGSPAIPCATCHSAKGWRNIVYPRRLHPTTVPLRGGHAWATCRQCHGAKANTPPRGTKCIDCHGDPHEKRFGTQCTQCHVLQNWKVAPGRARGGRVSDEQLESGEEIGLSPAKIKAVAFHNKTRFPLLGRHILVACDTCHKKGRVRGRRAKGRKFLRSFARCSDCHADEHRGQFAKHKTPNSKPAQRCEYCHQIRGLDVTTFTIDQHAQSRFPLVGSHRAVACRACHSRRRPKSRRFTYRNRGCNVCHRDPHHDGFVLEKGTAPIPCATCHGEESFHKLIFPHKTFPLEGGHAKVACISCHRPNSDGDTVFKAASRRCESCHRDPHQGQFARKGKAASCERCHQTSSFKIKRFDHQKKTSFPLLGKHAGLACNKCHQPVRLNNGAKVVMYRLGTHACVDCHESGHKRGVRGTSGGRAKPEALGANALMRSSAVTWSPGQLHECDTCHEPTDWRNVHTPASFDHRTVGYPLEGRHGQTQCGSCHRVDRPLGRACSNCHEDRHQGRLGNRCGECHRPTSWRPSDLLARHRRTRLPLTGFHALADCVSCHPESRQGAFRSVPAACYGCHADRYNDPATHPNHADVGFGRQCEQCHRPTGWSPAFVGASSVAVRTHALFPLSGAHARTSCVSCHGSKRPTRSCESCHAADRLRARDPDHQAPGFSTACAHCHGTQSWRPARNDAHTAVFPLVRPHDGFACSECHNDGTRFTAVNCTTCHQSRTMVRSHQAVAGFSTASRACLRCHPLGRR